LAGQIKGLYSLEPVLSLVLSPFEKQRGRKGEIP